MCAAEVRPAAGSKAHVLPVPLLTLRFGCWDSVVSFVWAI